MKNTLFLLILLPLLAFGQETETQKNEEKAFELIRRVLENPDSITELDLSGYSIKYLPPDIGQLTNLEKLWLQNNSLTELPSSIGELSKLTDLRLEGNRLNKLPKEFWRLSSLERLWLNNNRFSNLDAGLGNLSNLQWLILDENPLVALPSSIEGLVNLEELWLQKGELTSLPESLTNLARLKKLMLWGNPLEKLPVSLSNLSSLAILDLRRTPIKITDVQLSRLTWEMEGCDIRYDEQAIVEEPAEGSDEHYAQGDEFREVIDFKYDYERHRAAGGIFPPLIYPIGWNEEGVVAYKEDICDGGCGCCRTAIVIRDIKSNRTIKKQAIRSEDFGYESEDIWDDKSYRESTRQLLASYKIMPTGIGPYVDSSTYHGEKGSIGVSIEKFKEDKFRVYKTEDGEPTDQLIFTGELSLGHLEVLTEVECIGYFLPELHNYVVFVLLLRDNGYESDQDYTIELVGVELP